MTHTPEDRRAELVARLEASIAIPAQTIKRLNRDYLGRLVREAWVKWAKQQPNPKPTWLVPYDDLPEPDKEVDRQIGVDLARIGAATFVADRRFLFRDIIAALAPDHHPANDTAIEAHAALQSPIAAPLDREAVARAIEPELFCGDSVREHRAASPRTVQSAKDQVLLTADAIIALLPAEPRVGEAILDDAGKETGYHRTEGGEIVTLGDEYDEDGCEECGHPRSDHRVPLSGEFLWCPGDKISLFRAPIPSTDQGGEK